MTEPHTRAARPRPLPTSETPASADRALEALDACVRIAETTSGAAPVPATVDDFRAVEIPQFRAAIERVLMGRDPEAGLDALLVCGVLDAMLPEIKALVGFGDGEFRHKDVWKHTKQVVRQAVPRTEVRWAAMLHDIGKVKTRKFTPDGEVHFFGHAEVGASMFDRMQRRLPLFADEPSLATSVRFLILHHLRASHYDKTWTDSAVRRFTREMGACLTDLLDLSRADITTKSAERKRRGLESISELSARVRAIAAMDAKVPPLPKGLGTEISARFGIAPSPRLGEIIRVLRDAVDGGEIDAQRDAEYYLEYMRTKNLV